MLLANYVYEKEGMEHKKVIEYKNVLPQEEIFGWNDVKHFHLGQYILMHSVIYRTELLRQCRLELPKHTFYVDNIFVRPRFCYPHYQYEENILLKKKFK